MFIELQWKNMCRWCMCKIKNCKMGACKSTCQKYPKTHVTSELSFRPLRSVAARHLLTHLRLLDDKDH